jgi:hypothetical protein
MPYDIMESMPLGHVDRCGEGGFFEAGCAVGQSPAAPGALVGGKAVNARFAGLSLPMIHGNGTSSRSSRMAATGTRAAPHWQSLDMALGNDATAGTMMDRQVSGSWLA